MEVCGKGPCNECELPLCLDLSGGLYVSAKSLADFFPACLPSSYSLLQVRLSWLYAYGVGLWGDFRPTWLPYDLSSVTGSRKVVILSDSVIVNALSSFYLYYY